MEAKIRVFISYSHKDKELAEKIARVIQQNEMIPLWDKNLSAGSGFHEQIKEYIDQSHVFMPLLTQSSSERGWVHQEIGYAMAVRIPIFPLTTDDVTPGGMLQMIQAVQITDDEQILSELLNLSSFQALIKNSQSVPLYECAHLPEERTRMIIDYSNKISKIGEFGMVRQKGGLSSFHIPDDCILKPIWAERYFPEIKSEFHKRLQRNERLALEKHANVSGYEIIITPDYAINGRNSKAAIARLETLRLFLKKPGNLPSVVAFQTADTKKQSLTIVGDWFLAESVSFIDGDGFTNTFFTRDASEIERRTEDFECELQELLDQRGWTPEDSREKAIAELEWLLKNIKD
jgi:hypothetical protein